MRLRSLLLAIASVTFAAKFLPRAEAPCQVGCAFLGVGEDGRGKDR